MRNDRHLAIKLRKKGMSYKKISKELGIPKSTIHYWFSNLQWSQLIKKKLTKRAQIQSTKRLRAVIRAQQKRWKAWRKQYREEAKKEFPILKSNPLFVAGLMLYWGEGDSKPKNETRLSNTDPRMIKLFYKFLQEICKIPKKEIRACLLLYPDLCEEKCKNFWHKTTGIPLSQFNKSSVIYGRHPTKRLENGICIIRVNSSRGLKEKILVWINLLSKNL